MGRKNTNPFPLGRFDPEMRYDIYFETSERLVALRHVQIVGVKTWEEYEDPDEATELFLVLKNAHGQSLFLEGSAVTFMAEAGTNVNLDVVSLK
ncbi:MAG: hypothetical protein AAGD14_14905 [Planctomycetota bacterium]